MNGQNRYREEIEKIFGQLPEEERENLEIIHYAAGDVLMEENALDDAAFFYILKGVAEGRKKIMENITLGTNYVPVKIEKGDFVGLYEALQTEPKRRKMGIYAKSDVVALKIARSQLYRWLQRDPTIINPIVTKILTLSWKQRELITGTNNHTPHVRMAFLLKNLYFLYLRSCYEEGYTGAVRILDTRQEMSVTVGSSIRTVDRIVSSFKDQGLISIRRGKVYIDAAQSRLLTGHINANT